MEQKRPAQTKGSSPDPEVPTTPYWRRRMQEARKAAGMTQVELGDRVSLSQPTISDIESGVALSSQKVPHISRVLGISPPAIEVVDEYDERWLQAGRRLRDVDRDSYVNWLDHIERDADRLEAILRKFR